MDRSRNTFYDVLHCPSGLSLIANLAVVGFYLLPRPTILPAVAL